MGPRYRFFGGKGGVGKTTCAAATAIALAREGAEVLAISTDPAHSLGDALGRKLGAKPAAVKGSRRLAAMELAADRALDRWLDARREILVEIADRGTWLDREDVRKFLALSFPGVDELVALLEIARIGESSGRDEVVVDTAPTGHTLRMLAMPQTLSRIADVLEDMHGKHRLIAEALGARGRETDADRLLDELRADAAGLIALVRDPMRSSFHWVTAAEPMAVAEAADGVAALDADGIAVAELIVNRLTPAPRGTCALCTARRSEELATLAVMPGVLVGLPLRLVDESDTNVLAAVGKALAIDAELPAARKSPKARAATRPPPGPPPDGRGEVWAEPGIRLVLVGGKGGVGKTTCTAALALEHAVANPTSRTLLLSIDPAHSLADALGATSEDATKLAFTGAPKNLTVRELDAPAAFADVRDRYRGAVDDLFDRMRGGSRFDASYDRAIVRDLLDLAPPGLDEIFAILAVVDALGLDGTAAKFDRVFLDTAPTGHALRLLEMPERAAAWVRTLLEVLLKYRGVLKETMLSQDLVALSRGLRVLRELLADPKRTAFVAVARPEPMVVAETRRLVAALKARKIPLRALVVNALTALPNQAAKRPRACRGERPPPGCARCKAAAKREAAPLRDLAALAKGCAIIHAPRIVPSPRGADAIRHFRHEWRRA